MKRKHNGLAILGLLAFCAMIAAGIFLLGNSSEGKGGDAMNPGDAADGISAMAPGEISSPITVMDISSIEPAGIGMPEATGPVGLNPSEALDPEPAKGGEAGNDIPLTVIEDKPGPPEPPATAYTGNKAENATPDDVKAHEALDPAIKNPDAKPKITPPPVDPVKPKSPPPASGDKGGNGYKYVPGFGMVLDEGGGSQFTQSELDPEHTDFDNIIGY